MFFQHSFPRLWANSLHPPCMVSPMAMLAIPLLLSLPPLLPSPSVLPFAFFSSSFRSSKVNSYCAISLPCRTTRIPFPLTSFPLPSLFTSLFSIPLSVLALSVSFLLVLVLLFLYPRLSPFAFHHHPLLGVVDQFHQLVLDPWFFLIPASPSVRALSLFLHSCFRRDFPLPTRLLHSPVHPRMAVFYVPQWRRHPKFPPRMVFPNLHSPVHPRMTAF